MKIYSAYFHHNGFFIQAEHSQDFWILLSRQIGWGRFSKVKEQNALTGFGSLFELRETRSAGEPVPHPVISGSNVLWHLQEACEVLKSNSPSLLPAHLSC